MFFVLLRAMRPHQWVKNLFVLAPLVFAKELFDLPAAFRAFWAFALFSAAPSAIYLFNDLADLESDRNHPIKSRRAIASGRLPVSIALRVAVLLIAIALLGSLALPFEFFWTVIGYFVLNVGYTWWFKYVAYMD